MTKNLFLSILFVLPLSLHCQIRPNSIYFELGGNGYSYSVNYERNILNTPTLHLNTGIGFTTLGIQYIGLPLETNVLFGKEEQKHFLEAGIGATPFYGYTKKVETNGAIGKRRSDLDLVAIGRIGYRYVSEKGFLFRVAFTPVFQRQSFPWAGISLGKNF